ncbi:hypothetical protein GUJ93_ZPchr0010g11306 [Zizania palustris]|uniref:Uncharacterized protein n=1 Tax=Zizania palustris TaxID=103762 RepID=A0A8J6BGR5_ZIZPA|nr:hypothetical protein GUJ93_ZPchr0010g11306 [Zizania palustris]
MPPGAVTRAAPWLGEGWSVEWCGNTGNAEVFNVVLVCNDHCTVPWCPSFELDDGLEFSFTDKRRFARVRLFEDEKKLFYLIRASYQELMIGLQMRPSEQEQERRMEEAGSRRGRQIREDWKAMAYSLKSSRSPAVINYGASWLLRSQRGAK